MPKFIPRPDEGPATQFRVQRDIAYIKSLADSLGRVHVVGSAEGYFHLGDLSEKECDDAIARVERMRPAKNKEDKTT